MRQVLTEDLIGPAAIDGIEIGVVPTQRRSIEVRDRLFESAMAEFAANGVQASRVESIVADAGTSWGTFFRYFPRKEDVLLHATARHFRSYVKPVFDLGIEDGERSIRDVTAEVFSQMTQPRVDPRVHAEMIIETVRHTPRFAAILGQGDMPIVMMVANLIEEGQRRGEIRKEVGKVEAAVVITAGVMFSTNMVLRAVADGNLPGSEIGAVASRAFRLAWDGIGSAGA